MLNSIQLFGLILLGGLAAGELARRRLSLPRTTGYALFGLPPLSSVVLVLLANTQVLYSGMDPALVGMVLATILLRQLLGPFASQTAIKGFGEATCLLAGRHGAGAAGTHGGAAS